MPSRYGIVGLNVQLDTSFDELFVRRGRKIAHDLGIRLTPTRKRCQRTQTVVLCSETRAVVSTSDTSHDSTNSVTALKKYS